MTMTDIDALQQMANQIYHQYLPASNVQAPTAVVPTLASEYPLCNEVSCVLPKPEPVTGSGLDLEPSASYYFLSSKTPQNGLISPASPSRPDVEFSSVRGDFPIFRRKINDNPLIWLDNAATTQKPQSVIDAVATFYSNCNSNVHRGVHTLAVEATEAYESARDKVHRFINAASREEVIFLRGATEAINLVAQSYGRTFTDKGDEILLSTMEHHSNIVPWQLLTESNGAIIREIPINDRGEVILGEYEKLLSRRTRIVAITHLSNVLGTINPIRTMIEMAHFYGAVVLIDGAQAVPRLDINLQELDADFYTFSGHKMYAPTGIGILYGKKALLEEMPPWQGGGSMIDEVNFTKTTYNSLPYKFEAGTGSIAAAVGLGAALDYLQQFGLSRIEEYERILTVYATSVLNKIPGLRLIGTAPSKTGVISFIVDGLSPEQLARNLDREGIAVRAGHHCAQPTMQHYGVTGTVRVSLGIYNNRDEIDFLGEMIRKSLRTQ
jgi:cysteine desulfurase/selenocysteine lyase